MDTGGKLIDFSCPGNFQFHALTFSNPVYGFPQTDQRADDLAGQDKAHPDAEEERKHGNAPESPFRLANEVASFLVILLDSIPVLRFQIGGHGHEILARRLKIRRKLHQRGIFRLDGVGNLSIE